MKILLLGATGRTGKLVLKNLLASGFHVNVLTQTQPHHHQDRYRCFHCRSGGGR